MIDFAELLRPASTRAAASSLSKKAALEDASSLLADAFGLDGRRLLEGFLNRERLGSTGLGEGVAIPHCRFGDCPNPIGALLTLTQPVDFDAPDDRRVDILFALVVPTDEERAHLEILGALARVFDDPANLLELREATSNDALHDTLQRQIATTQLA